MKDLIHILKILQSKNLIRDPDLTELPSTDKSVMGRLIRNIKEHDYSTDQEAAIDLYGAKYDKHVFEILKSKLLHRALNALLHLSIVDGANSPRDAVNQKLRKQLIEVELLLLFGARNLAIKLLHKIERMATKFQITERQLECAKLLRSHSWYNGDNKKFLEHSSNIKALINQESAECRAEELFQQSSMVFVQSKGEHSELIKPVQIALDEMDRLFSETPSFKIQYNRSRLVILLAQLSSDHERVVKECNAGLAFLNKNKIFYSQPLFLHYSTNAAESLILQRMYDAALRIVIELRKTIPPTHPNRMLIERLAFLSHIGKDEFKDAHEALEFVYQLPSFSAPNGHNQEEWTIFNDYFVTIQYLHSIQSPEKAEKALIKRAMLAGNSKKAQIFSMDKSGLNIAILIHDVIRLIIAKQYSKLIQCDKILENYMYRHLQASSKNHRSLAFIKLLRLAIKYDYDKEKIQKKGKVYLQILTSREHRNLEPVEIIPYEKLWELLVAIF